jgi:hypothetical protein
MRIAVLALRAGVVAGAARAGHTERGIVRRSIHDLDLRYTAMNVSPRKLAANRANAKKSTGPRTVLGKRRSSMNSLTHGLFSERIVLPDEDPARFARFRDAMLEVFLPSGIEEQTLCEKIISLNWRLRRVQRISSTMPATTMLRDLDRLSRHEQRLELSIDRCMDDFVKLRRQSQKPSRLSASQVQHESNVATEPTPVAEQHQHAIERFEPTAIDTDFLSRGLNPNLNDTR